MLLEMKRNGEWFTIIDVELDAPEEGQVVFKSLSADKVIEFLVDDMNKLQDCVGDYSSSELLSELKTRFDSIIFAGIGGDEGDPNDIWIAGTGGEVNCIHLCKKLEDSILRNSEITTSEIAEI